MTASIHPLRATVGVALLTLTASATVAASAFTSLALPLVVLLASIAGGSILIALSTAGQAKTAEGPGPLSSDPPHPPEMNEDVFLSKLTEAVLITNRDGVIARASRGVERILGYAPAVVIIFFIAFVVLLKRLFIAWRKRNRPAASARRPTLERVWQG